MKEENKKIGLRIRKLREDQQLSRERLSEKANISNQFLADIETGKKGMSVETFTKICNALSVSPNNIIYGFDSRNSAIDEIISLMKTADEKTIAVIKEVVKAITELKSN